jgi:hypothetical protein
MKLIVEIYTVSKQFPNAARFDASLHRPRPSPITETPARYKRYRRPEETTANRQ